MPGEVPIRTEVLPALAHTVVHEAKSSGLLPQDLAEIVATHNLTDEYQILSVAAGLYKNYQTLLRSRLIFLKLLFVIKQILTIKQIAKKLLTISFLTWLIYNSYLML